MIVELALTLAAAFCGVGAGGPSPYFEVHLFGGQTLVPFLGDTDKRTNYGAGLVYSKPEPRLKYKTYAGELMQEAYYEHSHSPNQFQAGPSTTQAVGYLAGARYEWAHRGSVSTYLDLGLGLQVQNKSSDDVPSLVNSTPFVDFGLLFPDSRNPVSVGLRWLHISNARTKGQDAGQNQFFLDLGMRF